MISFLKFKVFRVDHITMSVPSSFLASSSRYGRASWVWSVTNPNPNPNPAHGTIIPISSCQRVQSCRIQEEEGGYKCHPLPSHPIHPPVVNPVVFHRAH